jgi:hypothetical protein
MMHQVTRAQITAEQRLRSAKMKMKMNRLIGEEASQDATEGHHPAPESKYYQASGEDHQNRKPRAHCEYCVFISMMDLVHMPNRRIELMTQAPVHYILNQGPYEKPEQKWCDHGFHRWILAFINHQAPSAPDVVPRFPVYEGTKFFVLLKVGLVVKQPLEFQGSVIV